MFYFLAAALAVLAGIALTWPLLRQGGPSRNYGLSLVTLLPIAALFLYQQVGSPLGIGVSGKPQPENVHPAGGANPMVEMVARLEQRLQENPADLEGWILLGRSYKTMQQYEPARAALLRAYQMAPDDPLVMAELAEAQLFASGQPEFSEETLDLLRRALEMDPEQQKALWLLGIAASQDGDDALAVQYWQKLVGLTDPASPVAQSVQEQIDRARDRLGIAAPEPPVADGGFEVRVSVDGATPALPEQAVLFLIIRDPAAPVPPLGAKRVARPEFPLVISVTDADSMMAERPISATDPVQVVARISMSGSPVAGEGDLESTPVNVSAADGATVELKIARLGD